MQQLQSTRMTVPDFPERVQLHLTNRCNANCVFCWRHDKGQDFDAVSDERWLEIADELIDLGIPEVAFSGGGEPLLRANLMLQMMERFSEADVDGCLITNGTLINERIAEKVVELRMQSIQFSIHGPTSKLNDRIMDKVGDLDLALRGIKLVNEAKRSAGSAVPELSFRVVMLRENLGTLPNFVDLAEANGIEDIWVRMVNGPDYALWKRGDRVALKEGVKKAVERGEKLGIKLRLEFDPDTLGGGT